MANFEKLLQTSINDITNRLDSKYNEAIKEKSLDFFDKKEYDTIVFNISMIEKKREVLYKKIRQLESDKENLKPKVTFESEDWLRNNGYYLNRYGLDESRVQAIKYLHEDPINTNRDELLKLSSKFVNSMNIATGAKEKRNILLSFYNLDWKSLGIDIPPEMNFNDVAIKDGKVISDTSKLLSN